METLERQLQPKKEKGKELPKEEPKKEDDKRQFHEAELAESLSLTQTPKRSKPPLKRAFSRRYLRQQTPKKQKYFYDPWFNFYFRRTSVDGCRFGGILRIFFAIIFLLDNYFLKKELEFLLSPIKGVLPVFPAPNITTETDFVGPASWSLFDIQPQSDKWIVQLYWISVGQGFLLLFGILPRFQVLGIFLNLVSLHRRTDFMVDDEDALLRLWAFFLLFMPLHHFTIYDLFRNHRRRDESWPMWPWRLWQTEMIFMYWSSSMSKLLDPNGVWIAGDALYWMEQSSRFYPGLLNPDLFLNRYLPLKISCWYILMAECTCWLGVWMEDLQADIVAIMVVVHLALEVSTNRLGFNWLVILGWITFMVQADYLPPLERRRWLRRKVSFEKQPPRIPKGFLGPLVNLFIVLLTVVMAMDVFPPRLIVGARNQITFHDFRRRYVQPVLKSIGIWQGPWKIYHVDPFPENSNYQAFILLRNGTVVDQRSPDWSAMTWWERKRTVRLKKFFTSLATTKEAWVSYCEHIVGDIEDDVLAVELVRLYERARAPRNTTRWMARMRQPMDRGWVSLVVVRLCKDKNENCETLVSQGNCQSSPKFMHDTCRMSCGFCNQLEVEWGKGLEGQIDNSVRYTPEHMDISTARREKAENRKSSQCAIPNEETTDTCQ